MIDQVHVIVVMYVIEVMDDGSAVGSLFSGKFSSETSYSTRTWPRGKFASVRLCSTRSNILRKSNTLTCRKHNNHRIHRGNN